MANQKKENKSDLHIQDSSGQHNTDQSRQKKNNDKTSAESGKNPPKGSFGILLILAVLVLIVIIALFIAIEIPNRIKARDKAREAEVKANCHVIQATLERYYTVYNSYPGNSAALKELDFISSFPPNPFAESREEEMKDIKFGSEPFEGNFTYVPVTIDNITKDYFLLGYGSKRTDGMDCNEDGIPDHVINVVQGGIIDVPPLASLLK